MTATYQAGDIVQVRKTIEVTESGSSFVRGLDVQTGDLHQFYLSGATAVEMVKKAVQKSDRKPNVGASVSGRDIGRIWWKRGTVIRCVDAGRGAELVLHADGLWHTVSEPVAAYEFDDLNPDAKFQIKYLP